MKNNNYNGQEIFEEVEIESSMIDKDDLNEIISEEKKIIKKSSRLDLNRFDKFIKQIKLVLSLLRDFKNKSYTDIPWRSIALISAAILYFVNPFDVIPDILPVFGFTDDALLFAAVFKSIQDDLEKYSEWKGLNTDEYF
ncbi:MAG: YkvA family protein [Ignavibacteria bacterium]